jgi:hypothetical protein
MTVSGGVTSSFSETLVIEDNIILLNSNVTGGSPSENAGIEVSRGASANVQLRWNESTDKWQFTNDGTAYYNIPTADYVSSITGTTNQISVSGSTGSVVVGIPNSPYIPGNLSITGSNITIVGTRYAPSYLTFNTGNTAETPYTNQE